MNDPMVINSFQTTKRFCLVWLHSQLIIDHPQLSHQLSHYLLFLLCSYRLSNSCSQTVSFQQYLSAHEIIFFVFSSIQDTLSLTSLSICIRSGPFLTHCFLHFPHSTNSPKYFFTIPCSISIHCFRSIQIENLISPHFRHVQRHSSIATIMSLSYFLL